MNKVKKLNKLKEVLDSKGIKASFVAKQLNYNPNSVYNWIHQRSQPSLSTLNDIGELIGCSIADLVIKNQEKK
jgi:putative transcriptional regulator